MDEHLPQVGVEAEEAGLHKPVGLVRMAFLDRACQEFPDDEAKSPYNYLVNQRFPGTVGIPEGVLRSGAVVLLVGATWGYHQEGEAACGDLHMPVDQALLGIEAEGVLELKYRA